MVKYYRRPRRCQLLFGSHSRCAYRCTPARERASTRTSSSAGERKTRLSITQCLRCDTTRSIWPYRSSVVASNFRQVVLHTSPSPVDVSGQYKAIVRGNYAMYWGRRRRRRREHRRSRHARQHPLSVGRREPRWVRRTERDQHPEQQHRKLPRADRQLESRSARCADDGEFS